MIAEFSPSELERLERAADLLFEAEDRLPVLKSINWDRSLATTFFASGEKELPKPVYTPVDPTSTYEQVNAARALIDGSSPVHDWLKRLADVTERTAGMLNAVGTPAFYGFSSALYGSPTTYIADGQNSALDLAFRLDRHLSDFDEASMRLDPQVKLSAEELKLRLDEQLPEHFGKEHVPEVIITADVSAKAAAGKDYIKLRDDAEFSDLDADQLLQHEALVHIATGYNGRNHGRFKVLGESHPGNAQTQEGLAVFAEFITGSIDPRRFRRLANRVIAINMAAEGADFIEIYKFFRENGVSDVPFEAFESARRVFRGGTVTGGAPFTKDSVYLSGLVEVHSYLRAAVRCGDASLIQLLFIGKIDVADLDAMDLMLEAGLLTRPTIMPPWARDMRYLVAYLSYSTFLNQIDISQVATRYSGLIERARNRSDA
ncbi:MAG: hypothetical protein CMK07_02040 [Ponticaulis sp.]|nr:hypothetical protein [Ponticaulis sp.]